MAKKQSSYPLALALAILLHGVLFGFLFFHFILPAAGTTSTPQVTIVQASMVNANPVALPAPLVPKVEQDQLHTQPTAEPPAQTQEQAQAEKTQQDVAIQEQQALAAAKIKALAEKQAHQQQLALQRQQEEQARQQALRQQKLVQQQAEQQKKQKQAALAKQQAIALAKQKKAQQQLLMKQLQAEQQQLMQKQVAQEQQQLHATAISQQQQGVIDKYKAMIVQAISQNWLVPDNMDKSLSCQLLIQVGPGGAVLGVQVVRSSGNPALDRSAQAAVFKASPLPVPQDPALFDKFRNLRLTVRPENIISG
jgi:colicin import membrane protein